MPLELSKIGNPPIYTSVNILDFEEVKTIEVLPLPAFSPIWHTRNVWLTSFYFAGMRISDVLRLKWSDIKDEKFDSAGINTIRTFDYTLKQEKKYKENIEKKIQLRNSSIENMDNEIQNLNTELDKLPTDDPKRSELEAKIKEKRELMKTYEKELSFLNGAKPNIVQSQLRNDLMATLNPDGSRNVRIVSETIEIWHIIFCPNLELMITGFYQRKTLLS